MICKVSAFTVLELTIAMLLTSILVSVTYSVLNLVSKSYGQFSRKNDAISIHIQLDRVLMLDFAESERIFRTSKGLYLIKDGQGIFYEFNRGFVIRRSTGLDSFQVNVQQSSFQFRNLNVKEELLVDTPADKNDLIANQGAWVDKLLLTIQFQHQNLEYIYHKKYSASDLIQRTDALR